MPKPFTYILAVFAALITGPIVNADMRGQVVCEVPADDAVLLTWQVDDGSWRATTPSGGTASFDTEADALDLWNDLPFFVCDLTIRVDFRERPGRLHRLDRSSRRLDRNVDLPHAAEADPRVLIVAPEFSPDAEQTCAGKWLGTSCWMELANRPGCYLWNQSLARDETAVWTAECTGGTAHGTGSIIYSAGPLIYSSEGTHQVATGRLDHGKHEGHWVLRSADGSIYEYSYVNGVRHGTSVQRLADGSSTEYSYVNGLRHGTSIHRLADGTEEEGPYRNGRRNGDWVVSFPDGRVHEGRYSDDVQLGHWSRRDADGNEAEGYIYDGKETGLWVFRFASGDVMEGPYVDGQRHGIWTRRFADGAVEKGRYVNGEKQGMWIIRDGKFRYRTKYVDGRPKGKARDTIEW